MHALKLAFRNILRNKRRTIATVSAVMISCAGLLLFAGYVTWAHRGAESHTVTQVGHIQLSRKGYYALGAGNPSAFAIDGYARIKSILLTDSVLKDRLQLVTGQLLINGLVTSSVRQTSTPFVGLGVFPAEHQQLIDWNPYHIYEPRRLKINRDIFQLGTELDEDDADGGTLGTGLAGILQVKLDPSDGFAKKENPVQPTGASPTTAAPEPDMEVPGLTLGPPPATRTNDRQRPVVELLSVPPSGGTPNMVSLSVRKITARATKEMDDRLLKMPITAASALVFPGEEIKVTSILLLLRETEDVAMVKERLVRLIEDQGLDLEIKTWFELVTDYQRSIEMIDMFFTFTLCVVGVVLIFTIFNTIHMGVVERTGEIGTVRAMGMTRGGIITGFLLEGFMLGLIGAGLGVLLSLAVAALIDSAEIVYHPPIVAYYTKLEVFVLDNPVAVAGSFFGSLLVAVIASLPAARRAARMSIADALRH